MILKYIFTQAILCASNSLIFHPLYKPQTPLLLHEAIGVKCKNTKNIQNS